MQPFNFEKQSCGFGCGSFALKIKSIDQDVEIFGEHLAIINYRCEDCGAVEAIFISTKTLNILLNNQQTAQNNWLKPI